MKRLLLAVVLVMASGVSLFAQPVVSNICIAGQSCAPGFPWASHSALLIQWDINIPATHHRVLYGPTSAYTGMYSGSQPAAQDNMSPVTTSIQAVVSGMHYSTAMHFCPQSSTDNITWSTCIDTVYNTPALPGTHPAPPTPASTFSTAMPNVSGYVAFHVSVGCADLVSKWTSAQAQVPMTGAVLAVDPNCPFPANFHPPGPTDVVYFLTSGVTTGTSTITCPTACAGYTNGDPLHFGADSRNGGPPAGLNYETTYYACNVTSNTFRIGLDSGCSSYATITTTGNNGQCVRNENTISHNELLITAEWPLGVNWRVPEGVRYDSTNPAFGTAHGTLYLNSIGFNGLGMLYDQCPHDVRFMNEITTAQTAEAANSTVDPTPWGTLFQISGDSERIWFDRAWVHGQGYPNREHEGTEWQGIQNAVINSEFDNFDFGLAYRNGLNDLFATVTGGGNGIALSTGKYNLGYRQCNVTSPFTASYNSGAVSGPILVYEDMNCNPQVIGTTGMSMTCSGCTYTTQASPNYPFNGSGNLAAGRLASYTVVSGVITGISTQYNFLQNSATNYGSVGEGPTGILALCAGTPGPMLISNSKIEAAGIGIHFDDSCSADQYANPGSNNTITRNTITLRNSWVPTDPSFAPVFHVVRNLHEHKQGNLDTITANQYSNQWSSLTPQGYCGPIMFPTKAGTGISGVQMNDVLIQNNSMINCSAGMQIASSLPGGNGLPPPMLRIALTNNLITTTSTMYDPAIKDGSGLAGFGIFNWGGAEDMVRSHNTCVLDGPQGTYFQYQINNQIEGYQNSNELCVVNDPSNRLGMNIEFDYAGTLPTGPASFGKAQMDWMATQGSGNPVYTFNPVLVPWTTAVVANWVSGWTGTSATIQTGATSAARIAAVGFVNFAAGNYALTSMSPYHNAASDGTDFGVNFATLNNAQGIVGTPSVVSIGTTSASIQTTTPDFFACPVLVSSDNWVTYTSFPYTGGPSTTQLVNLTSLLSNTNYKFVVACAVQQPSGTFTTTGTPLGVGLRGLTVGSGVAVR